ncbi:amidohydrolase family protein [Streptomyces sp. NBC_01767]|uniref:amidohydrolase family protein n=1 Tax=Streptomyces sp. NBC_01767 TaxID=2975937 RepID=UPI00225081E3|nr:amidohydrolase family protein [Streptomyces sp. NBC_01767]MCX4399140.1 amidohydrolase [Streptomyces sp. NBC_01767]
MPRRYIPQIDHDSIRTLVGSDWPICLPRGSRADSLAMSRLGLSHLAADQLDRVLRTNAVRVYGLGG